MRHILIGIVTKPVSPVKMPVPSVVVGQHVEPASLVLQDGKIRLAGVMNIIKPTLIVGVERCARKREAIAWDSPARNRAATQLRGHQPKNNKGNEYLAEFYPHFQTMIAAVCLGTVVFI